MALAVLSEDPNLVPSALMTNQVNNYNGLPSIER